MPNYWNAAGQCFPLPEQALEPPDCWADEEPLDEEGSDDEI